MKSQNQLYNQEKCFDLCFDLNFIESNPCNCTNTTIGYVYNDCVDESKASSKAISLCSKEYLKNFFLKNILDKCSRYCPMECQIITFNYQVSSLSLYNKTRLRIFYRTLKHTMITQEPKMLILDLVSNIGGTFGLFIGVSFITLIELTEIIIEIFLYSSLSKIFCDLSY
jgi:hypothetical protein